MSILPRRELRRTSFAGLLKILMDKKKRKKEKGDTHKPTLPHTESESAEKLHWFIV